MSKLKLCLCLFLCFSPFLLRFLFMPSWALAEQRYKPNWKSIDSRPLPSWYDEAKIGIFLHWGVFSVPSYVDEWFWDWWLVKKDERIVKFMERNYPPNFTYPEFASHFTAELFDANQWAKMFVRSGARYVVLTTKHHEGFTLWPSKYSSYWNAMNIGPRRDLVSEVATAVRTHGLRFGVYHSWFEWFNPLYISDKATGFKQNEYVRNKARPELEELITTYKPDLLWSDGDGEVEDYYWNSTDFLAWLYNDSPVRSFIVTNDRYGNNTACRHGGFFSCQDRYSPGVLQPRKWENAMTIDKQSWGYRREAQLADYLSIEELLQTLVTTIACGGNLLINVGPTKDGTIDPIFEERLLQLGDWLDVNGAAIYGSNPWPTCQSDTLSPKVWYTQPREDKNNNKTVYGFVLDYPNKGQIYFSCIKASKLQSVQLLGLPHEQLEFFSMLGDGTLLMLPITVRAKVKYVPTIKFQFK